MPETGWILRAENLPIQELQLIDVGKCLGDKFQQNQVGLDKNKSLIAQKNWRGQPENEKEQ